MSRFLSRFYHISVLDLHDNSVEAQAHYLDSQYEMLMHLAVGNLNYKVTRAKVEVIRNPLGKSQNCSKDFEELTGVVAYKGIAQKVLEATATDPSGLWANLLFECVKALRQARAFIWDRTGINPLPFRSLIERDFKDSCIFFSTPESINSILEPKQLEEQTRGVSLFNRYRYCFVEGNNDRPMVTAGLSDSYHEIKLTVNIGAGRVIASKADILRAPQTICYQAQAVAANLLNKSITDPPRKWEQDLLGPGSCTHLGDLAREIVSSLNYWEKIW